MFEIRLDRVAQQIVSHNLRGKGSGEQVALYLKFDVRLSSHGIAHTIARGLHLLYHQVLHHASVSVFSAVTPSPFDRIDTVKEFKHEVTHDSCWRDLRVFNETYFTMANEVNVIRKNYGLSEIAPVAMNQFVTFAGLGEDLFQWVSVKVTKDETDERNYRRVIQLL